MFEKILNFFKRIFRNRNTKLLEAGPSIEEVNNTNINDNNKRDFLKEIRFDDGKEGKELLKDLLADEDFANKSQEETKEIQEKVIDYIDVLVKKIEKCQTDIAMKQVELRRINNQ